jgi:hypothetical protein
MSVVAFFVVSTIASTIVGSIVGDSKGRGWPGTLLGFLLGWIGVIIIACMSPTDAKRIERMQRDMQLQYVAQQRMLGQPVYPPQQWQPPPNWEQQREQQWQQRKGGDGQ